MAKKPIVMLSVFVIAAVGIGFGADRSIGQAWKFGAAAVGQCWTGLASAVDSSSAVGLSSADCSLPHSTETIAIAKLPATIKEYPTKSIDTLLTPAQETKIHNAAVRPILGELDLGGVDATRLVAWEYPPTIEQWKRGARWLRIDFFLREPGWPLSFIEPVLTLKGKVQILVAAAKKNPDLIGFCVDTASNDQLPTMDAGKRILTDCTKSPRWRLVAVTNLVKKANEAFPGASAVEARAKAACEAFRGAGVYRIAYTDQNGTDISKADWSGTYTSSDCWISKKP